MVSPPSAQDCVNDGGVVQVFAVLVHALHAGPGHELVRDCVIEPVCPAGQATCCVCAASGVHWGGTEDTVHDCVSAGLLAVQ